MTLRIANNNVDSTEGQRDDMPESGGIKRSTAGADNPWSEIGTSSFRLCVLLRRAVGGKRNDALCDSGHCETWDPLF